LFNSPTVLDYWNPGITWLDVQVGDFNDDGKSDLIGRVQNDGTWWASNSTGAGHAGSYWGNWSPGVTWADVRVGDINGDGADDLIANDSATGYWWLSTSNATRTAFDPSVHWADRNPAITWTDVQVGDFNGDGKSDLTVRASVTGQWFTLAWGCQRGRPPGCPTVWDIWEAIAWAAVRTGKFGENSAP